MKINNGFNILPWYDSLEKQNCKKWYAYGQAWPLLCPQGFILPFQFISDTAITISSNIYAISVETGQTIDLGVKPTVTEINRADITYYIVKLVSTSIVNLPIGRYNLRMNTSEGFLYSEELVVINNANECIKVEYWNEDTLKFTSGEINFTDDFHFIFYINSTIGKPEYEFEEELTKRLGYKFIESQTSNKVYKFSFVAPEYICDAMRLIRMCDYIKLTTKFDSYNALSFAYEPKWQEQGDLAAVDVEFDTDCIIQKLESFNRRAKESFYNALLADIDEPVLFSTDTVAQYYTEYTASGTISGKLIRQLTAISEDELVSSLSSIVLPVDNQSDNSQVAKKAFLSDIVNKLIPKVNLSDYLLKSVWDKVFEIRTDRQGKEYIFGKLPVVTQYGITMYANGGDIDLPSLYAGLPIDGKTLIRDEKGVLMVNPDIELGGGVSNFWDLSGIPSWITNSKPKYSYSEIEGTPDLSKYALVSQIPSLSGYATESWVNQQNYAIKATTLSGYGITDAYTKTNVDDLLKSYVTLGGTPQTITGEKNFVGGLKVNGSPIYYDTEKKYWKLEGDLLVTGGVTMYGSDSSFTPSTIMDALLYDDTTLGINSNGQLYVKGGTSGGGLDITALQNYLTQNSYLNVTSGDNRYLLLSGGTLTLENGDSFKIRRNKSNSYGAYIAYETNDGMLGRLGMYRDDIEVYFGSQTAKSYRLLHEGNYSNYALPLSGGEISSTSRSPLTINTSKQMIELQLKSNSSIKAYIGWNATDGVFLQEGESTAYIGMQPNKTPYYFNGTRYILWHEGNFTPSNYLPLSGGTLTSSSVPLHIDRTNSNSYTLIGYRNTSKDLGYLGFSNYGDLVVSPNRQNGNTNYYAIWHNGNDGSGSGLDADLLDGQEGSWYRQNVLSFGRVNYTSSLVHDANVAIDGMLYNYGSNTYWRNTPDMSYGQILTLKSYGSNELMGQLAWDIRHGESDTTRYLWWRAIQNESKISNAKWHQIAFTDSNVASATYAPNTSKLYSTDNIYSYGSANPYYGYLTYNQTYNEWDFKVSPNTPEYIHVYSSDKLRTARTIWGQSFDGTGNISGNMSGVGVINSFIKPTLGTSSAAYLHITNFSSSMYDGVHIYVANQDNSNTLRPLVLQNGYGNVGIGTGSPTRKLDIVGSMSLTGEYKIGGYDVLRCYNSALEVGRETSVYQSYSTNIWGYGINFYNSGGTRLLAVTNAGNFGFGVANPSAKLHVSGDILATGGITMYSMRALKNVVDERGLSLSELSTIKPTRYTWKDGRDNRLHFGGIADDIQQVLPEVVYKTSDGILTMDYGNAAFAIASSLIQPVVDHEKRIAMLEEENKELRNELERLKAS